MSNTDGTNQIYLNTTGSNSGPLWVGGSSVQGINTTIIGGSIQATPVRPLLDDLPDAWKPSCAGAGGIGHHVSELIEYIDGVVIAYCDECRQRVRLARVPGGIHLPHLQLLVELLMSQAEGLDEASLLQVAGVIEAVRRERQALDEAEALIQMVISLIDLREPRAHTG